MLKTLEAVRNGAGANDTHVSIRPPNDENRAKLLAWVEAGQESELTLRGYSERSTVHGKNRRRRNRRRRRNEGKG